MQTETHSSISHARFERSSQLSHNSIHLLIPIAAAQTTDGAEKARLSTLQIGALSTTHTHFADQEKMVLRTQLADERRENAKLREELKEAKTALEESRQRRNFGGSRLHAGRRPLKMKKNVRTRSVNVLRN